MAFHGRNFTFDNSADIVGILPFGRATLNTRKNAEVGAGVNVSGNSRVCMPAFVGTIRNPTIVDFAAFRANELKAQTPVFTLATAVWNKF